MEESIGLKRVNEGYRQRKERDSLRLSYAVPKVQWASILHTVPMAEVMVNINQVIIL